MNIEKAYAPLINECVVIDVSSPIVYIGKLIEANEYFVTLQDVDVHALENTAVSREVYVLGVAKNGLQPNRKVVELKQNQVLSLSKLSDIIRY